MSQGSTLYRFKIDVSDVDRSFYDLLDFRVARHASESDDFLLTRVLAFALNYQDGLVFSQGIGSPDDPALSVMGNQGQFNLWIDIGNPSARRLHKASKSAAKVRIYTYKDVENLKKEMKGESIHKADSIEAYSIDEKFLKKLAHCLNRDNQWSLIHNEGELIVNCNDETLMSAVTRHELFDTVT